MKKWLSMLDKDKDAYKIEDALDKEFSVLWEWFVDNKELIYFGEDKKITFSCLNVSQS